MKALIIEDKESMSGMICSILEEGGIETKVVGGVDAGLEECAASRYDVVVLDTSVDVFRGMRFVAEITPAYNERENRRERTDAAKRGPGVVVIRAVSERVPADCSRIKAQLVRPFTTQELKDAVASALPKEPVKEFSLPKANPAADPAAELTRLGITYGESYVFLTKRNGRVQDIMRTFAKDGYDMFLITASRTKVVMDRYGLDKGAEVFTLKGRDYKLGSMVDSARSFIERTAHPVVAVDDLDNVIEHSSVDRAVTALREVLSVKKKPGYTVLVSVDGELLTDSIRNILTEIMVEYGKE